MTPARPGSIEHWAAATPDAIALIEGERALDWRSLNTQADALAHGLRGLGLGAGDIVAVRTQVRLEWVVIAGALAKLGCTMVALNWRLTAHETAYLLRNSGAGTLVCDDAALGEVRAACAGAGVSRLITLDAEAEGEGVLPWAALLASRGPSLASAAEPPLLIYTSGTTGLPKGVATGVPAGADERRLREYREYRESIDAVAAAAGEVHTQLLTMPLHHASGPSQVWGAVRKGRCLVMLRRFEPEATLAAIARHRVGQWAAVPTMLKRIAALPEAVLARHDCSSLRRLTVGAAPVPQALKQWAAAYFGAHCLQENYGSTETSMVSALPPGLQQRKPGSSGRPFRHVRVEVRDADGRRLPPGEVGELWVRTPATIERYLNAPPLGPELRDAEGFFRIGDMGWLDEDGDLYITDRAKDMIISGGVNIYPAEIEAVLMQHPAVQDAAVIGIPDDEFGEQVLAYCEPKPGGHLAPDELRAHCVPLLASYKRPRRYEIVDELPRNTMGKVLKRDLRDPYWAGRERKV